MVIPILPIRVLKELFLYYRRGITFIQPTFIYASLLRVHLSTGTLPTPYRSDLIMSGWDDGEVQKA
jgi:hypothetical protein